MDNPDRGIWVKTVLQQLLPVIINRLFRIVAEHGHSFLGQPVHTSVMAKPSEVKSLPFLKMTSSHSLPRLTVRALRLAMALSMRGVWFFKLADKVLLTGQNSVLLFRQPCINHANRLVFALWMLQG